MFGSTGKGSKKEADASTAAGTATVPETGEPTEAIAKVPEAAIPAPAPQVQPWRGHTRVRLVRIDPYSVTRLAFVVSVVLMIVATAAAALVWIGLETFGLWDGINRSIATLLSDDTGSFDITDYVGFTRTVGGTLLLSGINVILLTALATVTAHIYNLVAVLLGGIHVTFSDD